MLLLYLLEINGDSGRFLENEQLLYPYSIAAFVFPCDS